MRTNGLSTMEQLQLATDLVHDSIRPLTEKFLNFPMWYLASCTNSLVADGVRQALSTMEALGTLATHAGKDIIAMLRSIGLGEALASISAVSREPEGFLVAEAVHAWSLGCLQHSLQALRAVKLHLDDQPQDGPCCVFFDFRAAQMLPEGLQWDRAIHADVLQQAIGTASDTSDSEGPGSPPGIESSPLHPTNQGQGTSTDGPWGPWVQGGFEGQLLTADGTAGDSDFDEIMTIQGIFRDQTVVRRAAYLQGFNYMARAAHQFMPVERQWIRAGKVFRWGDRSFPMVSMLISAPNSPEARQAAWGGPASAGPAGPLRYPKTFQAPPGDRRFQPVYQGLLLLDTCSAGTWITAEVAMRLGLRDAMVSGQGWSAGKVEVELDGQLLAVNISLPGGPCEHVCVLGQDFLTLHRKELLVNYSEDVVSMRDVE